MRKFKFKTWECDRGQVLILPTGIRDVNDVEIHEGDIVKTDSLYGNVVINVVLRLYGSYCVSNHTFKEFDNVEVIGNIYQNAYLLEEF